MVAVNIDDNLGIVTNPHLVNFLEGLARDAGVKTQRVTAAGVGTTDAATIQLARTGVPVAAIAVAGRYDHGPLVMLSMKELEQITEFTALVARNIHKFRLPWTE